MPVPSAEDRAHVFHKASQNRGRKKRKHIVDMLTKTDRESFDDMFGDWCVRWNDHQNERSKDLEMGRSHYVHGRIRSAYLSIRRNMPYLYTWYDNIKMGIPNTTNLIDGYISQLKRMLRCNNGLKREHREKLVIGGITLLQRK